MTSKEESLKDRLARWKVVIADRAEEVRFREEMLASARANYRREFEELKALEASQQKSA
jgi:hypothetical protein